MNLFIERRTFVQANGDVDEYMTVLLQNPRPTPESLEGVWLKIPVTDALSDAVRVCDGLPGNPEWWAGELDERFLVAIRLRGSIPPQDARIVGAHILSRERCSVEADRVTFHDPFLLGNITDLPVARLDVTATVVFPLDERRRLVRAPAAIDTTSRTATWEFRPASGRPYQLHACQEATPSSPPSCLLDDGIAALHSLIGRDACGESIDLEDTVYQLQRALREGAHELPRSIASLTNLEQRPPLERQQCLRLALRDLVRVLRRDTEARSPRLTPVTGHKVRRPRRTKYDIKVFAQAYSAVYDHWKDNSISSGDFTDEYVLEELRERDLPMHRATLHRYLRRCEQLGPPLPHLHRGSGTSRRANVAHT